MFPESFVEKWLDDLTRPGDVVMDPFSGRGTTAFQAVLKGRKAVASDTSPVSYCLTKAKTNPPTLRGLRGRISTLERVYEAGDRQIAKSANLSAFFEAAFSETTLRQLVFLRSRLRWRYRPTDAMLAAIILGILHGDTERSSRYLSNQMPRTISTKPAYSIRYWDAHGMVAPERDVFLRLRDETEYRYRSPVVQETAVSYQRDVRNLPAVQWRFPGPVSCVICSPPYFDTTSAGEDQWLRVWFLGGPIAPSRSGVSPDDRRTSQKKYWQFLAEAWASIGRIVDSPGNVVIRIGSRRLEAGQLVDGLVAATNGTARRVKLVSAEPSDIPRRQTSSFLPKADGCRVEIDCHFEMA